MILELKLKVDYNPTTEECKIIKVEAVNPKTASTESTKIPESSDPTLILDSSKYSLNQAAVELMKVEPDVRIDIKYDMINGVEYPVIGTEENFGVNGGNKLTKALTVSYRGKANERLSRFGSTFTVTPMKTKPGLFVLIGDKEPEPVPDEIEIKEDMTNNEDLPITDMDNEPLTFDDDPTFPIMEDAELIEPDALVFE